MKNDLTENKENRQPNHSIEGSIEANKKSNRILSFYEAHFLLIVGLVLELVTCSSVLVRIRESGAPYSTRELSSRSEYNIKDPYIHSSVLTSTSFLFPSY